VYLVPCDCKIGVVGCYYYAYLVPHRIGIFFHFVLQFFGYFQSVFQADACMNALFLRLGQMKLLILSKLVLVCLHWTLN